MTVKKIVILAFALSAIIQAGVSAKDIDKLKEAFFLTFNEPARFKDSGIFQLLGYTENEIAQIGRITPRPESVDIEIDQCHKPGSFNYIRVICHRVLYYNLTIHRATFEIPHCSIDMTQLENNVVKFISAGPINLKTEASEKDLLRTFNFFPESRSLSSIKIRLENNRVRVSGRVKKGFFVVGFKLHGDTVLKDPRKVYFDCHRLVLNGGVVPRNIINSIFSRINPVFDASKTWLNLNIDNISVKKGFVETIARIDRRINENANCEKNLQD